MKKCKMCENVFDNVKRIYCSNACKFSDTEYNTSRCTKKKKQTDKQIKCKLCDHISNDVYNVSGHLRIHIESKHNIQFTSISNHYDVIDRQQCEYIGCPECEWKTKDLMNKSGCFTVHIHSHGYTPESFIDKYPTYSGLWNRYFDKKVIESSVKCLLCGDDFHKISNTHMKSIHGISISDYKRRFPNAPILSDRLHDLHSSITSKLNISRKYCYQSKEELQLIDFIKEHDIRVIAPYRNLGVEFDIFLPDFALAIEYNGLYWHSEYHGGKTKKYHLNKTEIAEANGIKLIHIFQDEWVSKREIVEKKILNQVNKLDRRTVHTRKCTLQEIAHNQVKDFLNANHIQGSISAKIHIGAFYDGALVSVMSLSNPRKSLGSNKGSTNTLEIVRYAVELNTSTPGMFDKMIKFVVAKYNPSSIISYADRRWTSVTDNIYEKNGFKLESISDPNYWYIKGIHRYHRFNFTKGRIVNKLGGDKSKTEWENMLSMKFDRVWDCGNLKYVLFNR